MSSSTRQPLYSPEWLLLVLTLLAALVVAAAVIHVVSDFGFTALGEPLVVQAIVH